MKDKNEKHKFKESKIGKIIYGFLLFMPLFAIGVTCGYAMFNKNAKDSYEGNYQITQQISIEKPSIMVVGVEYNCTLRNSTNRQNSYAIKFTSNSLLDEILETYPTYTDLINCNEFLFRDGATTEGYFISFRENGVYKRNSTFTYEELPSKNFTFTFNGYTASTLSDTFNNNIVYQNVLTSHSTLDNIFYYSVDKVTQSNLFNWVTTSNIYTGMSNFTTAMSVTNTFIPMILTYWLIISVIYFLYDMVLILLTVLHRKIHNLQDSI